jgi:putative membrane protein
MVEVTPTRNNAFILIFMTFICGMLACNYDRQGERESENLARTQPAEENRINEHDGAFLMQAGAYSLKMIEIAKLGMNRAKHEDVRELAREVEHIHQVLYKDAVELAQAKGVSIPVIVNESDKIEIEKLDRENADVFEKRLCDLLKREHDQMLQSASRFTDDGKDSDVRAYARNYSGRVNELVHNIGMVSGKVSAWNGTGIYEYKSKNI